MSEPDLTPVQALGVALSVAAPTMVMGDAQAAAPDMLAHLEAMGYRLAASERPPVDPEPGCVFCEKARGETGPVMVFEPLNPVTPGHLLVVPTVHVKDATTDPDVTALVVREAARVAADAGPCNLITSVGHEATQSVFHLHVHVVPRREGDGLNLPWSERPDAMVDDYVARIEAAAVPPEGAYDFSGLSYPEALALTHKNLDHPYRNPVERPPVDPLREAAQAVVDWYAKWNEGQEGEWWPVIDALRAALAEGGEK